MSATTATKILRVRSRTTVKRSGLKLLVGIIALLGSAMAHAVLVTVEPDDFAHGTDISTAVSGITLSTVGAPGPVLALDDGAASTGSRTFGNNATSGTIDNVVWLEGNGFGPGNPPGPVLRADFHALTDFIAIDIINQDSFDFGIMRAFDDNGVELEQVTLNVTSQFGPNPAPQVLSISRVAADIAWITVAGTSAQDQVHLDNLVFNRLAIPEPASLLLTVIALSAFRLRRGFVQ